MHLRWLFFGRCLQCLDRGHVADHNRGKDGFPTSALMQQKDAWCVDLTLEQDLRQPRGTRMDTGLVYLQQFPRRCLSSTSAAVVTGNRGLDAQSPSPLKVSVAYWKKRRQWHLRGRRKPKWKDVNTGQPRWGTKLSICCADWCASDANIHAWKSQRETLTAWWWRWFVPNREKECT